MPRKDNKKRSKKSAHKSSRAKNKHTNGKNGINGRNHQSQSQILKQQGNAQFKEKNYEKAIDLYSKAIALEPNNHTLYSNRCSAYTQLLQNEAALNDANKCIELKPEWTKGYIRKLNIFMQQNQISQALSLCKHAINICDDPTSLQKTRNDAIFALLNIEDEDNNRSLFNTKFITNTDLSLPRIQFILEIYSKWVQLNRNNNIYHGINMYDIINDLLSPIYNTSHFLNDYRFIINNSDTLNDDDSKCDADTCYIMDRNERDRQQYTSNTNKRQELFFITNNEYAQDEMIRNISIQQILDSLHCFMYHTLRIKNIQKYVQNDDIDHSCNDNYTAKLIKLIETRTRKSRSYRSRNNRDPNKSKFYTIISSTNDHDSKTNKEIDERTVTDHLINALEFNGLDNIKILCFEDYIRENAYDTDALIYDLENQFQSNIEKHMEQVYQQSRDVLSKNLVTNKSTYNPGYRYFYWDFYKDNDNKTNRVCKTAVGWIIEENAGYALKDWYINKKYKDFKDELLHNKTATFSRDQYETTLRKATMKLDSWLKSESARKLECLDGCGQMNHWLKLYGIGQGDTIKLEHIIALLCYTNYTEQSYHFSRSFRKVRDFESDEELKERHREFYFWGRYIRECIECFGEMMEDSRTNIFWHGINVPLIFDSTSIKLNGPLSTTGNFQVAVGIFGANGIVIDIKRTPSGTMFFNCNYWSDFTNEDERFFIGGLVQFNFVTIRDVKNHKDYQNYVRPLTMLDMMIKGFPYSTEKITKKDLNYLQLMIKAEIDQTLEREKPTETPLYCLRLWHHFLARVEDVIINIFWMGIVETEYKVTNIQYIGKMYGYDIFRNLFFLGDEEKLRTDMSEEGTLCLSKFFEMFMSLKTLTVFNAPGGRYNESIMLDDLMVEEIFNAFKVVEKSKSLVNGFKELRIVKPIGCIDEFIEKNKEIFRENGLDLKKIKYKNVRKVSCDETLSISRLSQL